MTPTEKDTPTGHQPFRIDVPEAELDDLRRRLDATRWPEPATAEGWVQGVPLEYLREFCDYWANEYDWRAAERRLNDVPQYRTTIDGLGWHYVHARSPHAGAQPLVLLHGWPGSFREFTDLVAPLTHPVDPADAFHVVCPSLPGFAFSDKPSAPGWGIQRIAAGVDRLMASLGYDRYGVHGGDWGSVIAAIVAHRFSPRVIGVHLTIPIILNAPPDPSILTDLSDFERLGMERTELFGQVGTGYLTQMATKPQTLGYGLVDSPAGQAAWILEKFFEWTDCDGDPRNAVPWDAILDNISLYWFTRSGASSARIYWESMSDVPNDVITVPTGCSIYPKEHVRVARRAAEPFLPNILQWHEMPEGGHFASLEQPVAFLDELTTFFRSARGMSG